MARPPAVDERLLLDTPGDAPQRLNLARGDARTAANKLAAFDNEVRALERAGILDNDTADLWLFELHNILAD